MKVKAQDLTPLETELMNILWDMNKGGSVREVMAFVARPMAYTTISTILRILVDKGVLRTEKVNLAHQYIPRMSREQFQKRSLARILKSAFGGVRLNMAVHLLKDNKMSLLELEQLQQLVEEKLGDQQQKDE